MAVELLANLAASTLSADITSTSATTLTVTSATGFPAAATGTSQFRILIGTEIMIVTNVSGTTFTVTRGAESTTAATHSSGDPVTHVVTAGVFQAMFGGGTAGQALTKTGSADYAASWQTDACGGGDYYGSGGYAHGTFATGSNSSSSLSLNRLYVRPFWVATRRAFDRIAIQVSSAGTTGAVLRLGIYSPGGGTPGSLLLDAGTVASTSTGTKAATISQTLDPGIYWVAVVAQVAACGVVSFPATATPWAPHWTVAPPNGAQNPAKSMDSQSGALPSTFTLTGDEAIVPAIALRAT